MSEQIAAAPFIEWFAQRERVHDARIRREAKLAGITLAEGAATGAHRQALDEIGWYGDTGARRMHRWQHESLGGQVAYAEVANALDRASTPIEDVYPDEAPSVGEVHDRWCEACRATVITAEDDICPWCDSTTVEPRPRRGGWKRLDRTATRKLTERHLRALHLVYNRDGASVNALAERIFAKAEFKSKQSCASRIYEGWAELGLPARERVEAVKLACTVHGLAPKHGPRPGYGTYKRRRHQPDQPQCAAVKSQPPRKGWRCTRPAMFGSVFCQAHDPEYAERREALLVLARARQPRREMLPMAPFVRWLHALYREHGSYSAVADTLDMERSQCYRFAKGQDTAGRLKTTIDAATVARYAERTGTSVDAIYGTEAVAP